MPPHPGRTARSSSRSSKRSESQARAPADGLIAIGAVTGAHALRGAVRIRVHQPPAPSLAPGRAIILEIDGTRREMHIQTAAAHGRGLVLVHLEGVADRTAAEALRGARVLVPRSALPPPGPGEFYWHEVVGFRVETTAGEPLGTVEETMATGLNDVWVVRGNRREHLIPVIADVVRVIDRAGRRIVIEPLPGLLD